jgi:hypothetical protein
MMDIPNISIVTRSCIDVHVVIIRNNADLLPPVVAMHACIVLGLCEHDIPNACDVESMR